MTTQVKVEITQMHMPVMVETVRPDGTVSHSQILRKLDDCDKQYVHSGQSLRVREMTQEEVVALGAKS